MDAASKYHLRLTPLNLILRVADPVSLVGLSCSHFIQWIDCLLNLFQLQMRKRQKESVPSRDSLPRGRGTIDKEMSTIRSPAEKQSRKNQSWSRRDTVRGETGCCWTMETDVLLRVSVTVIKKKRKRNRKMWPNQIVEERVYLSLQLSGHMPLLRGS